ncbi:hypothetical protein AVEN_223907-1 [Araneus ventricosus]|uniref:Uncharacterized protein n=1 Tax=Araneus ventricosus TaxID=182803 RepID=A0A4Y2JBV4_ARAVE|nr:hypothetical protein AVEN_223907-1 [Araneus ventricosus]
MLYGVSYFYSDGTREGRIGYSHRFSNCVAFSYTVSFAESQEKAGNIIIFRGSYRKAYILIEMSQYLWPPAEALSKISFVISPNPDLSASHTRTQIGRIKSFIALRERNHFLSFLFT